MKSSVTLLWLQREDRDEPGLPGGTGGKSR